MDLTIIYIYMGLKAVMGLGIVAIAMFMLHIMWKYGRNGNPNSNREVIDG